MKQFAALLRKDNHPVRYLVVDDSVFARKNLIKMIEMFSGEVAAEAGDGLTAIPEYKHRTPDGVPIGITMPQQEGNKTVKRLRPPPAAATRVKVSLLSVQDKMRAARTQ